MNEIDQQYYEVQSVSRGSATATEPLGSKPKFWFGVAGQTPNLFKADDRGTGEDWAELICSKLCDLLGLPHVNYELASEVKGEVVLRPGVVCKSMVPSPNELILGNQLLQIFDEDYPTEQRYKVHQHTVQSVAKILQALQPPTIDWMSSTPPGVSTALGVFTGYVMLDAWVANQDRHHENWGAIWPGKGRELHLAPTFDHGAGLARNLLDEERRRRLETKDKGQTISAFSSKARSAFFRGDEDTKPLFTFEAFEKFRELCLEESRIWLSKLKSIDLEDVSTIIKRVPRDRMTPVCKEFTLRLLEHNRTTLLENT